MKSPLLSQAIIHGNTVYVSGNIGLNMQTMQVVEGSVADRTKQALLNIQAVLEAAGSDLQSMLKVGLYWLAHWISLTGAYCNIYLTNMNDYAAMNKACTLKILSLAADVLPLTVG